MATVVLSYAGAALGTLVGGPVGGAIGRAIGGIAGNAIDQRLFGKKQKVEGPRLNDLRVMASEEGNAIPAIWGRMRVSGQVIWATNLEEVVSTETQKTSSKGGGGDASATTTTTYSYFANFAVGLCDGRIDSIGRVWADGKVIDIDGFTTRLYRGSESQNPDSLITSIEGVAPAYRGLAYIVFERLPLERFGNRLPQLSFEVFRPGSNLGQKVKAVNIIPGATEFGYDTALVSRKDSRGKTKRENMHASTDRSDWTVSIDQLQDTCPNVKSASLVVAWFGNDLRCGTCTVRPRVDNTSKVTTGATWSVSGASRSSTPVVSNANGVPAYSGSPSDGSVIRAIEDLKARNIKVTFYPFLLMDIPANNSLPDPYGGSGQSAYPWRGRITASVAPGRPGTVDKTAAATTQVAEFMGTCGPGDFTVNSNSVTYTGPAEWSYRRMILHYAALCAAAGGVEAFLIGSELRGLTTLRGTSNSFPMVTALRSLAADVKVLLPSAKISYAADWSEYFGYQPADASGDVFFHLDPLWSYSAIDFIGIDNYMPLSDWRDGSNHLDAQAGVGSIYDRAYLQANIRGGEGFDWYYASQGDRDTQTRTLISDGAYNQSWVFRYKDLANWWSNTHRNRPGGVQSASATSWVPQSKPIWFTEVGCPAVDKGTNQPNVFYDPKSSESSLPYYSGSQRDDLIQSRYVQVMADYWATPGTHNPISSVYGEPMVRADRMAWWSWDARPFPAFPARTDVWSDGNNFARGHWLNGRVNAVDLGELIEALTLRFGLSAVDTSAVSGLVDGFVLDRPMSGRDALESLLRVFSIDVVERDGVLVFKPRASRVVVEFAKGDLADAARDGAVLMETRSQETDLPRAVRLGYIESSLDYRTAAVQQAREGTASVRDVSIQLPAAVPQSVAQARADVMLAEGWAQRTTAKFSLPPSQLAYEPGDVIAVDGKRYRLNTVSDAEARHAEASLHDVSVYDVPTLVERTALPKLVDVFGEADVLFMDLALTVNAKIVSPWMAAQAQPWPGRLAVFKQVGRTSYKFNTLIGAQATMGETVTTLSRGLVGRVDYAETFDVLLDFGALSSVTREELLAGANFAAVGNNQTGYEILQFETATLVAANTYRLSGLLRAQAGSWPEMLTTRAAGQRFVLLNDAVVQPIQSLAAGLLPTRWRIGPPTLDHGHPAYVTLDAAATRRGLRPLRPAHINAKRVANGVNLSWIRQTRSGGDSWELPEVPLGEDSESYRLQVMNGTAVLRAWTPSTAQQLYTDAQLAADFGTTPNSLTLRVAQVSASYGAGPVLERTLNV
jgi:hypothetical protein